jgi:hypothetical protein
MIGYHPLLSQTGTAAAVVVRTDGDGGDAGALASWVLYLKV